MFYLFAKASLLSFLSLFWNDFSINPTKEKEPFLLAHPCIVHTILSFQDFWRKGVYPSFTNLQLKSYVELKVEIRKLLVLPAYCCNHHVTRDSLVVKTLWPWFLWTEKNRRYFGVLTPNHSIKARCLMYLLSWHNMSPVDSHDNFLNFVSSLVLGNPLMY